MAYYYSSRGHGFRKIRSIDYPLVTTCEREDLGLFSFEGREEDQSLEGIELL